jgi:threonine/homoserine/homoserine lactone efflux protein
MTSTLLLGAVLGLLSATIPGPFTALVAVTALQRGFWAGFRIAVVPLVTETVAMSATALVLSRLPEEALRWMGVAGGAVVLALAVRTFREADRDPRETPVPATRRTLEGVTVALLSPAPWLFWLLVGSPLFLSAREHGWARAAAFLGSFLLWFVGVYVAWAGAAALGHERIPRRWYRRVMVAAGVALALGGAVLVWQSWTGRFRQMLTGAETVEDLVRDSTGTR